MKTMLNAIFSENQNFTNWGVQHWGAILFFVALGFTLIKIGQSLDDKKQVRLGVGFAIVLLLCNIAYISIIALKGEFDYRTDLPLNFCVILPYLMPYVMYSKNKTLYGIMYFGVLGGTFQGIVTPHLDGIGFPSYVYLKFWLEHAGLIILILYATIVYKMRPNWTDYRNAIVFLFSYFFIFLMAINYLIGSNYGYTMNKPPDGSLLDFFGPWPLYLLVSIGVALPFFFILYLPFFIKDKRTTSNQ